MADGLRREVLRHNKHRTPDVADHRFLHMMLTGPFIVGVFIGHHHQVCAASTVDYAIRGAGRFVFEQRSLRYEILGFSMLLKNGFDGIRLPYL